MTISVQWRRFMASGGTRRQMVGTALAGLILGIGGVTIGTSLVQASERDGLFNFLEQIFRAPPPPAAQVVPRQPLRYANLPDARRIHATRPVAQTPRRFAERPALRPLRRRAEFRRGPDRADIALGTRTVCVRSCDGFLFPLGNLAARRDLPVHEAACAAACPNAATSLYTLPAGEIDLDRAVSLKGQPYRAFALANVYRQKRVADCSCQSADGQPPLALAKDLTLRRGDVVATEESAGVVTRIRPGAVAMVDFRKARDLSRAQSRAIEDKVGALRREADARAFRRAMRAADRPGIIRVAAGPGFQGTDRAGTGGFAPVRIVAPSPFTP
ncbi:DUF2865 domain-containing protein [Methylobacterium soli]|uniref:DUF2865 domain-containing protein n=1 Tax=Methylobacterium soli TaxID=553447 RepID=A0A6L3SV92_9HYPH|nr:DUF2865 domain-containing protein [Methylobacterium soli]KAB1077639.1 DUF2865 domain-containing protein [Methylobacterium soli]GJE41774.1 hypothetical protein AEGHOMDF_0940 [Methylobacterium soli]